MTQTPSDIMKAAANLVTELCVGRGQCIGFRETENEWLEQKIAKAILSERHRCALISRQWETSSFQDEHYAANSIADRIMSETKGAA